MVHTSKAVIIVDGSNLFHSQIRAGKPKSIWPPDLPDLLLPEIKGELDPICTVHYFLSKKKEYSKQNAFLNRIQRKGVIVYPFELKEYPDDNPCPKCNDKCTSCGRDLRINPHKEKKVDIAIATKMIELAYETDTIPYDIFIVVSGDKDLIPAIQLLRKNLGKEVYIAGFRDSKNKKRNSVAFEMDKEVNDVINLDELV